MPQETGIHRNGFVVLSSRREESFKAIGSQVLLPYLLAGLGMVLAGVVLDRVQVRPTARTYQTSGVSDGTRASNTVLLGVNLCPMRSGNGSEVIHCVRMRNRLSAEIFGETIPVRDLGDRQRRLQCPAGSDNPEPVDVI
ncbi:solute carrier family 41 member 1-like [Arapaima gigas]